MGAWFSNPEVNVDARLVDRKPEGTRYHLRVDNEGIEIKEVKVVLIGETGAGKTSLLTRIVSGKYSDDTRATIAASFLEKRFEIEDDTVKLQVWEPAGEEKFHSLSPIYYRGSHVVIIVVDITNNDPVEQFRSWLEEALIQCPEEALIYLVGSKLDLEASRVVSQETILKYAEEKELKYFETSAKDNLNVQELFTRIAHESCGHSYFKHHPAKSARKIVNTP